jgi:predicted PurR-regulated permease PerM
MRTQFNTIFLITLLVIVSFGVYVILKPFFVALLLAFVFSQLFHNWFTAILKKVGKKKRSLASGITCFLIFLLIFLPLVGIGSLAVTEMNSLYKNMETEAIRNSLEKIIQEVPIDPLNINGNKVENALKTIGNISLSVAKKTYQGTTSFIFMAFIMFFSLYYLLKDNEVLWKKIKDLSPLKNNQEDILLKKFVAISRATLKGSLVVAIFQGIVTAILLSATGVPSAIFLGILTVIFSLIPFVGAGFVWAPAGIIMLLLGNIWQGIVIILFGALVISTVDNILRAKLVGNESSLHPLLVFLSTIGGIVAFGMAGFLLGPILIVLFLTLLDIYKMEFGKDLERFNK